VFPKYIISISASDLILVLGPALRVLFSKF